MRQSLQLIPITSPSQCSGASTYNGCGVRRDSLLECRRISGRDNFIHDNYDYGAWWDTDNNGEAIIGNILAVILLLR